MSFEAEIAGLDADDTVPLWHLLRTDGSLYLARYVLAGVDALETHDPEEPFSAFVHVLHGADGDRHPHNHPWRWAASVILNGGYAEERNGVPMTYAEGDLNVLRPDDYHRITSVLPGTVTLFLCGRETHDWGFLVDGIHVPHAEYFKRDDVQRMQTVRVR